MLQKVEDILPEVYKAFPYIEEKSIEIICKLYLRSMAKNLKKGEQIVISEGNLPNGERLDGMIRFRKALPSYATSAILKKKHKKE